MTDADNVRIRFLYLLPVVLQYPLQLLSGKEYAALDSAERQFEPLGNLAVLEPGYVHEERYAVLARQAVHHAVYLLAVVVVLCGILLELPRLVYVEQVVGMVDKCLVTHLLAVVVDEDVAHDGIYPSLEVGVGGILVHVTKRLQRRLLQ